MALSISPLAEVVQNTMLQTCTVYKYIGADPTGQPQYAQGIEYPCRLAIRTERTIADTGDYITNSTVVISLPAEADVGAYDQIDLPQGYRQGAVIREVATPTDAWGQITHRVVRIA